MDNTDISTAKEILKEAYATLHGGDKSAARHLAEQALSLAPSWDEPWMVLAAAASNPRSALAYLEQAVKLNPDNTRAKTGMDRVNLQLTKLKTITFEQSLQPDSILKQKDVSAQPIIPPGSVKRHSLLPLLLLCLISAVVITWIVMPLQNPSVVTYQSEDLGDHAAGIHVAKPSHTPSPTPTFTPSPTPLPTNTPTIDPPSILPSSDAYSAVSYTTTYIVKSGDTLRNIAQQFGVDLTVLATTNNIMNPSSLFVGQQLIIPLASIEPQQPALPVYARDKKIIVDISEQHMYAYQGNELVYSFVVSTGIDNSTRVGNFSILNKIQNAYGSTWDIWMPYWLGIYWSGHLQNGIHALPILPNGATLWEGYLGRPISYGCVVLSTQEAQLLYDWAEIGTPVEIKW